MIKLPIILSEHKTWEQAVTASIQTRQKLAESAKKDKDYIRPIVLFQAENVNQDVTVDVLLNFLTDNENIPRDKIAVATGDQRELDSIDLFDRNCPIEYVITVQALKEGWDCSFAYILCSVANTRSQTAVEQLLGRVLRMPYARLRTQDDLNRAYAHVSSSSWPHAVSRLHDRLVSMGFEEQEAEEFIYSQSPLPLLEGGQKAATPIPFMATLTEKPDLSNIGMSDHEQVLLEQNDDGIFTLKIEGQVTDTLIEKVARTISNKKDKSEFVLAARIHQKHQTENLSPSQKGEEFSIPQLCLQLDYGLELAEVETCLDETGWNLLDYPASLEKHEFTITDEAQQWQADIEGRKIKIQHLDTHEQFSLDGIDTPWTELELGRWIDRRLHQNDPYKDVRQETRLEFVRRVVKNLLARGDMDMARLVRGKFLLERKLRDKIHEYRKQAFEAGYQQCLFGKDAIVAVAPDKHSFSFDPDQYPAGQLYQGPLKFIKHYYPRIGHMNGEETVCAQALDRNPLIKFWVRNLERQPLHAFWLPTSSDKFYPDFVAQLTDGRLLIVEYIGFAAKQIRNNISMIAKLLLQLPDVPLASPHSANMAPYYSGTSTDTLMTKLTNLTNALLKADLSNKDAQKIFRNIEIWSDGLFQSEKELLLLAIEKRSHFTFDMIHWIAHVSKLLLALSKAEACPDHVHEKLEKHAIWLFSTLSWIKDDKETISFVENFGMTETLFEMAFEAQMRECFEFSENARKLLIDWAFKAGQHQTGRATLESAIYALATLALASGSDLEINRFKNSITQNMDITNGLDQDKKDRTARNIRERAATLYKNGHWSSQIETVMGQQNQEILKPLLEDIANILSPNTADDPVRLRFI